MDDTGSEPDDAAQGSDATPGDATPTGSDARHSADETTAAPETTSGGDIAGFPVDRAFNSTAADDTTAADDGTTVDKGQSDAVASPVDKVGDRDDTLEPAVPRLTGDGDGGGGGGGGGDHPDAYSPVEAIDFDDERDGDFQDDLDSDALHDAEPGSGPQNSESDDQRASQDYDESDEFLQAVLSDGDADSDAWTVEPDGSARPIWNDAEVVRDDPLTKAFIPRSVGDPVRMAQLRAYFDQGTPTFRGPEIQSASSIDPNTTPTGRSYRHIGAEPPGEGFEWNIQTERLRVTPVDYDGTPNGEATELRLDDAYLAIFDGDRAGAQIQDDRLSAEDVAILIMSDETWRGRPVILQADEVARGWLPWQLAQILNTEVAAPTEPGQLDQQGRVWSEYIYTDMPESRTGKYLLYSPDPRFTEDQ